jgi:hypothetical protein
VRHVLSILEEQRSDLPSIDSVLSRPERFADKPWRKMIADAAVAGSGATDDLRWVLEQHPTSELTRTDIFQITAPDPEIRRRRIVIASFMWGYGTGGLRYEHTRDDIASFLADPQLDDRLRQMEDRLAHREVRAAYDDLSGIHGIGPAFFTKLLYFVGRGLDGGWEYPLILDTKVAESLALLTGYGSMVTTDHWPKPDSDSYVRYVRSMHNWARRLGTQADVIEFYLWQQPRGLMEACNHRYERELHANS